MAGILDLIANAVGTRHYEQQEKDQRNLAGLLESLHVLSNPSLARDQYNAKQDLHYFANELVGKGYKEHKPFIESALGGIGHAVLNSLGVPLHQRTPYIPESMRDEDEQQQLQQQQQPQMTGIPPLLARPQEQPPSGMPPLLAAPAAGEPAAAAPFALMPAQQAGATPYYLTRPQEAAPSEGIPPLLARPAAGFPAAAPGPAATQLAALGPAGVSPTSLTTGQQVPMTRPMSREEQIAAGGVPVNRRDPNSPVIMPLSPEALTQGQLAVIQYRGMLGKGPQGAQEYASELGAAVAQGNLTAEQAQGLMQKFHAEQAQGARAEATGTETPISIRFPATQDRPEHTETFFHNSRTDTLRQYGKDVSWESIQARGGQVVSKPGADKVVSFTTSGRNLQVQQAFKDHPEWGPPPKPTDIVRMTQRTPGEGGSPEFTFGLVQPEAAGGRFSQLRQLQEAVKGRYFKRDDSGNTVPLSDDEANQIADDMYINTINLRDARAQQQMGIGTLQYGIMPGQGVEAISLPPGVFRKEGVPQLSLEQAEQLIQQGGGAQPGVATQSGALPAGQAGGASGTPPPGLAQQMQGTQQVQPARIPPAIAPAATPSPLPTRLTPAAGFPSAAPAAAQPRAAAPPTPPPQGGLVVQPPPPGGYSLTPSTAVAQQYNRLGVPIPSKEAVEQNAIQAYLDALSSGQPVPTKGLAGTGAQIIRERYHLSTGELSQAASEWQGLATALKDNQTRQQAVLGIGENLDNLIDNMIVQARRIPDYGSRFKNTLMRDFWSYFRSQPDLLAYQDAGTAAAQTFAQLFSNASNSNAQLQAGAMATGMRRVNPNMTFPEMLRVASQIKIEKNIETSGYEWRDWNIKRKQAANPIGRATNVPHPGPAPKPQLEDPGRNAPMDGERRRVRGTNRFARFDALKRDAAGNPAPGWVEER